MGYNSFADIIGLSLFV